MIVKIVKIYLGISLVLLRVAVLKSVINQCSPIFSTEIIFLKCNLEIKTHVKK